MTKYGINRKSDEEEEDEHGLNTNLTREEKDEILRYIASFDMLKNDDWVLRMIKARPLECIIHLLLCEGYYKVFRHVVAKVGTKLDWIDPEGNNLCFYLFLRCKYEEVRSECLSCIEYLHAIGFDCFVVNKKKENMAWYLIRHIGYEDYPLAEDFEEMVKTLRKVGYVMGDVELYKKIDA